MWFCSNKAITLTGTPAFTAGFALCSGSGAYIQHTGGSFTGPATGARYALSLNGAINTAGAGANYFPGNAAGTNDGTGAYA
jgi:hypothetical protein